MNFKVAITLRVMIADQIVPADGFVVESPRFVALYAARYNGLDCTPPLLTTRSLDGKPLAESGQVLIYHGFSDRLIRLSGKEFEVVREEVVSINGSES